MDRKIGWELYRSFLGVLQEGSLSAAARALGVTQPTVGRHIAALEQALQLTLFVRAQAGLIPTDAALALRTYAEAMAGTAAALERAAANCGGGVRGVVRVAASEVIGVEVLPSIVAGLCEQYPELKIELVLSDRVQDLLHREADIAVRMFRPQQTQLIAQLVGRTELGLHATRDYLARHSSPKTLAELAQHALIGYDQTTDFIRRAARALPPGFERESFTLSADNGLAQLALIRAGAGIGICQAALARRGEPLVPVLPDAVSLSLDIWIVMHEDLRNSLPCRAVFEALAAGLRAFAE